MIHFKAAWFSLFLWLGVEKVSDSVGGGPISATVLLPWAPGGLDSLELKLSDLLNYSQNYFLDQT